MAKEFSKHIYNSRKWRKCRDAYFKSQFGTCEKCGATNHIEVHHIEELTPENINDPYIVYGWDNLQCLCFDCHKEVHGLRGGLSIREGFYFDEDGQIQKKE